MSLKSPFPYFGGKSKIAPVVWARFGQVANYIEPFFGSGAMLLARPGGAQGIETANDKDGYVSNFWRALQSEPDAVAEYADWPVNENDLHARHIWLTNRRDELVARLEGDAEFYDAKVAGWWVWGMACWIGGGFCSGVGPWNSVDGKIVKVDSDGVERELPHLGGAGIGVKRRRPHLGDAGKGVNRQLPQLRNRGEGTHQTSIDSLVAYMQQLSDRLRRVRVCCGNWSRVLTPTPTFALGLTAVFLDPPYGVADRASVYGEHEDRDVAADVRTWCLEHESNPLMRIALCGYEGEHDMPGWECLVWKARGGYANNNRKGNDNRKRERIWFSPYCLKNDQGNLF